MIQQLRTYFNEIRCYACNKLLGKASKGSTVEIKCKCGEMNIKTV